MPEQGPAGQNIDLCHAAGYQPSLAGAAVHCEPGPNTPDARSLFYSADGDSWRYVGFEPGLAPFHCAHATFSGDPFASSPSVRSLILEVLASSARPGVTQGRCHVEMQWHDEYESASTHIEAVRNLGLMRDTFLRELRLAFELARARPDDAELRCAAARALLLPGGQLYGNPAFALDSVAELARSHADVVDSVTYATAACSARVALEHPSMG